MVYVSSFLNKNLSFQGFNLSMKGLPQVERLSAPVTFTICAAYFLIGLITIFGNSFTLAVFLRRNFGRKRVHYFLINLAITDLTLAVIPVPLQILNMIESPSGNLLTIQYFFDVLTGLTSMYSLAFISVERLCAVCLPLRHRLLTGRHYLAVISVGWFIAGAVAIISSDVFTIRLKLISFPIVLHVRTLFAAVPLIVTIIAYCTLLAIRNSKKTTVRDQQQNRRVARTLLIVTTAFIVTWCPLLIHSTIMVYLEVYGACCSLQDATALLIMILNLEKLLQYGNSCINPFIYILRIPSFRMAFWEIFRCRQRRNNAVAGLRQNIATTSNTGGKDVNVRRLGKSAGETSDVKSRSTNQEASYQMFSHLKCKDSEDTAGIYLNLCSIQLTGFKTVDP